MSKTPYCSMQVPVPSFINKYLTVKYGKTLKLSKKSVLGLCIIEFSTKRYIKPNKHHKNNSTYTIHVYDYYFTRRKYNIRADKLKFIASLMVQIFYEDLFTSVDVAVTTNNTYAVTAIKNYLDYFNIEEDDLKLRTAIERYKRYKKSKKNTFLQTA